jgi:hypothetical protein
MNINQYVDSLLEKQKLKAEQLKETIDSYKDTIKCLIPILEMERTRLYQYFWGVHKDSLESIEYLVCMLINCFLDDSDISIVKHEDDGFALTFELGYYQELKEIGKPAAPISDEEMTVFVSMVNEACSFYDTYVRDEERKCDYCLIDLLFDEDSYYNEWGNKEAEYLKYLQDIFDKYN